MLCGMIVVTISFARILPSKNECFKKVKKYLLFLEENRIEICNKIYFYVLDETYVL